MRTSGNSEHLVGRLYGDGSLLVHPSSGVSGCGWQGEGNVSFPALGVSLVFSGGSRSGTTGRLFLPLFFGYGTTLAIRALRSAAIGRIYSLFSGPDWGRAYHPSFLPARLNKGGDPLAFWLTLPAGFPLATAVTCFSLGAVGVGPPAVDAKRLVA